MKLLRQILTLLLFCCIAEVHAHVYDSSKDILVIYEPEFSYNENHVTLLQDCGGWKAYNDYNGYNFSFAPHVKNIYVDGKKVTPSYWKSPFVTNTSFTYPYKDYMIVLYEMDDDFSAFDGVYAIPDEEQYSGRRFHITGLYLPSSVHAISHMDYKYMKYVRWFADCGDVNSGFRYVMNSFGSDSYVFGSDFGSKAEGKEFLVKSYAMIDVDAEYQKQRLIALGFNVIEDDSQLSSTEPSSYDLEYHNITGYTDEKIAVGEQVQLQTDNGARYYLQKDVMPYTYDDMIWKSSNEKVLTISEDGLMTAVGTGTAAISMTVKNGEDEYTAHKMLTVIPVDSSYTNYDSDNDVIIVYDVKKAWVDMPLPFPESCYARFVDGKRIYGSSKTFKYNTTGLHTAIFKLRDATTISEDYSSIFYVPSYEEEEDRLFDIKEIRIPKNTKSIDYTIGERCNTCSDIYYYGTTMPTGKVSSDLGKDAKQKTLHLPNSCQLTDGDLASALKALGFDITYSSNLETYQTAKSISLNYNNFRMEEGDHFDLQANILPEATVNKAVTWKSSDPSVATVSSEGEVTAVSEGTAVILATTTDGSNLTTSMSLVVKNNPKDTEFDCNKDVMFKYIVDHTGTELKLHNSVLQNVYVDGVRADNKSTYSFDYVGIHTILIKDSLHQLSNPFNEVNDINGENNTAKLVEVRLPILDNNCSSTGAWYCKDIYIYTPILPDDITLNDWWHLNDWGLRAVNKRLHLLPSAINYDREDWQKIINTLGYTRTDIINTNQMVTNVHIVYDYSSLTLLEGEQYQAKAIVYPTSAINQDVIWSISDTCVATIDKDGMITAKKEGQAIITAEAADGGGAKAQLALSVNRSQVITSITLSDSLLTLACNETAKLTATTLPEDIEAWVSWNSDNNNVAMVNSEGLVLALSEGEATITATCRGGLTAQCKVIVTGTDGISETNIGNIKLQVNHRKLTVEGLANDDTITVTSISGHTIYHGTGHEIDLPSNGIYIIKVKGQVMKVIVK